MERSPTPLVKWFLAIFLMVTDKRGVSAKQLQRDLHVAYQTAWSISHKIKEAIRQGDTGLLSGIVQLDEIFIGGRKKGGNRGRGTKKAKVLVALSTDKDGKPQRARFQHVPNLRRKTINRFVELNISRGSTIRTDKLLTYQLPDGYGHDPQLSDPSADHLRWLHVIASNLKAFIQGTFHGLDPLHLQRYLDEFSYRFDHRYSRGKQFFSLLRLCSRSRAVPYGDLIG
jgi:hypothetical protein